MPDTKITALAAITTVSPGNDLFAIVDVSDNSMAASGTTKNITTNQILGAGGTATLASATITGDLTVDSGTFKVNSGNNNVGIGFAGNASSGRLQISQPLGSTIDGALRLTDDATTSFVFNNVSSGLSAIWSSGSIAFGVGSGTFAEAMRLNSTGLGVGLSPSGGAAGSVFSAGSVLAAGGLTAHQTNRGVLGYGSNETTIRSYGATAGSGFITFRVAGGGASTDTEAMRIDASSNVGIGVTPSAWGGSYKALQLQSVARNIAATGAGLGDFTVAFNAIYDSTDSRWEYAGTGDKAGRYSQTGSGNHRWFVSNTAGTAGNEITDFASPAMTLDASGNLLVGKAANYGTGENNTLQLKSSVIFASDNTANAANRNWSISTNGSTAGSMDWTVGSTNTGWPNFAYRMQLTSAGALNNTTGTYGTISDLRLKENISDARNYLADLLKLRVVKYSLKEEYSAVATKLGFIAQEVELVFPNLVDQSDKEYDGAEGILSVKTSILIPMLLKAIQELTARVQTLEAR